MYTSFFGLNEKPFSITPDPRYLFMSERHSEALAHLIYGVTDIGGFLQLTGEVGSIFGIKVVVSDVLPSATALDVAGIMVNTSNFIRPRLGGVNFETEYSVVNQKTNLVASQSVGFDQLVTDTDSATIIRYPAAGL